MAEISEGAPVAVDSKEEMDVTEVQNSDGDASDDGEESEEELYEVERIVGISKAGNKTTYKVRWRGYGPSDDTWEPIENLQSCLDLIEDFEEKKEILKTKRSEERKKRKALMEGLAASDDEENINGHIETSKNTTTPLKDTFWKDLEEGRLNLFTTDMYSRVKGGGRSTRRTPDKRGKSTSSEGEKSAGKSAKKRRSESKENRKKSKERDKHGKTKKKLYHKHSKPVNHEKGDSDGSVKTFSDSSDTDVEFLSKSVSRMDTQEKMNTESEKTENVEVQDERIKKTEENREDSISFNKSRLNSHEKDVSKNEKMTMNDKNEKKSKRIDWPSKVKNKNVNKDKSKEINKSKIDKVEKLKKDHIDIDKPASPLKSYLSGGSTPPRRPQVVCQTRPTQASTSPDHQKVTKVDKHRTSTDSTDLLSVGLKRKRSNSEVCNSNSAKLCKQRKDSESKDSGIACSPNSYSSCLDSDSVKGRSVKRKDSVDFPQPLDDIWNGSVLPLLPEDTKSHERGADLSFDIELDDIDLDSFDKEKTSEDKEDVVDVSEDKFRQAVMEGDYHLVRRALNSSKQFDVDATDDLGITLLMYSAQNGHDDIAELLVNNGANINAQQKTGTTSLMLACEYAHICTVALLVELGANVNLLQTTGETALMKAVRRGHKQIVRFLLEHGANFSAQNNSGFSALTYAKMMRLTEIEDIIVDHVSRLTAEFDKQVTLTLNNTAKITSALFPLQCFPLCEGEKFVINFKHELQPHTPGVGYLLFISHARITSQDVKCRFYGPCAVTSATLNGVQQPPLTEEANFVLSCCPLQQGRNEIIINSIPAPNSKAKLVVCAYKAQLIDVEA